jgi:hypothetical protein
MKKSIALAMFSAVLAVPVAAGAADYKLDKVTGGGQIILTSHEGGPGQTIALNAQNLEQGSFDARGKVQYNDHAGVKRHLEVDCLRVLRNEDSDDPEERTNMAVLGGDYQADVDPGLENFRVYVTDNGQGNAAENDVIVFDWDASEGCEESDEDEFTGDGELGRGNVKIHKAGPKSTSRKRSARTGAAQKLGLLG